MFSWNKHTSKFFLRKFKLSQYHGSRKFLRQAGSFRVQSAESCQDLLPSFRLRYQVFHKELLRKKNSMGLDVDEHDAFADHLLFWNDKKSELIASVRIFQDPDLIHSPCQQEFYMDRVLESSKKSKMEFGRLCIHPDYRNSFINDWIWSALGEYAWMLGSELLYGIASLRLRPNQEAALAYHQLHQEGFFDPAHFSHPRPPYQLNKLDPWINFLRQHPLPPTSSFTEKITPLLQSFLAAQGKIVSEPAWDPHYQCLDFLTMIPTKNLYRRFYRPSSVFSNAELSF
jgi:putative hemolysin